MKTLKLPFSNIMTPFNKIYYVLMIAFFLFTGFVHGQDHGFKVLAKSGNIQIKKGADNWGNVKIGEKLSENHKIKVGASSYVGLVHTNGKTMEVDKAGEYPVADLAADFKSSEKGVAGKYAEFVINQMENKKSKEHTKLTGAVERSSGKKALKLLLPNSTEVYSKEVIIRWNRRLTQKEYRLTIKNMFDEVIHSQTVSNEIAQVNLSDPAFTDGKRFIVQIASTGENKVKSNASVIRPLKGEKARVIEKELSNLITESSDSALDQLILASFFEDKGLLADALTYYEKALAIAPKEEAFISAYQQFIKRNNLGSQKFLSLQD